MTGLHGAITWITCAAVRCDLHLWWPGSYAGLNLQIRTKATDKGHGSVLTARLHRQGTELYPQAPHPFHQLAQVLPTRSCGVHRPIVGDGVRWPTILGLKAG